MLRLHATMASINAYKVRLLLAILDLPYELVAVDMYGGEHKREPFLTRNPFGAMPAMQDADFTIADSHACLVYLARKYDASGKWLPCAAEREAKVAEWLSKSANEGDQGPWMKRAQTRRRARDDRGRALLRANLDAQGLGLRYRPLGQRDALARRRARVAARDRYRRPALFVGASSARDLRSREQS